MWAGAVLVGRERGRDEGREADGRKPLAPALKFSVIRIYWISRAPQSRSSWRGCCKLSTSMNRSANVRVRGSCVMCLRTACLVCLYLWLATPAHEDEGAAAPHTVQHCTQTGPRRVWPSWSVAHPKSCRLPKTYRLPATTPLLLHAASARAPTR